VQLFGISLATLKRYIKQRREEGHVRPKAIPGRPPKQRAQVEVGVLSQLQAHADATLEQHCAMWEQTHGERVSRWTISRAIEKLGWTRKKTQPWKKYHADCRAFSRRHGTGNDPGGVGKHHGL
jgi:transposase